MRKIFLGMIIVLTVTQIYAADSCIDKNISREAIYHLSIDPITTKIILSSMPDCDEKHAPMHMANEEIAEYSREDFYYQDKIKPSGRYDHQTPNMYEKHVMENSDQFNSGSEGSYRITANNYWINKIKDLNHPVFSDVEVKKLLWFFNDVWEDGDGSMHNEKLIMRFSEWINKYPNHSLVPVAQKKIERMKNYKGGLSPQ